MGEEHAGSETVSQAVFLEDFRSSPEGLAWHFHRLCLQGPAGLGKVHRAWVRIGAAGREVGCESSRLGRGRVCIPVLAAFVGFARESQLREKRGARHRTKSAVSDIRTNARLMVDSRHPGLEDAAQTGVFRNLLGEISGSNRVNGGE
jgi:hypothetical protein